MAWVYADRVKQISTTVGTGDILLDGAAVANHRLFLDVCNNNDYTWYSMTDGTNWETGYGRYVTVPTRRLQRTRVHASSNSNLAVDWAAGDKEVFITMPAGQAVLTADNYLSNVQFGDVLTWNGATFQPSAPSGAAQLDDLSDVDLSGYGFQDGSMLVYSDLYAQWVSSDQHPDGRYLMTGLPTSDPLEAGRIWNDNGTLKISAG